MHVLLADADYVPHVAWVWPFVVILLLIAVLPLLPRTAHWWEHNRNKLLVSLALAAMTLSYYGLRGTGVAEHRPPPRGQAASESQAARHPYRVSPAETLPSAAPEAHRTPPGWPTVLRVAEHALLVEYLPFIVLLFSLYVIAGGILVRGDIRATPRANTIILAIGGLLASVIGTTGAAMVLIRLLLRTNAERERKVHTFVFFIFIVANIGGTLLPIGDPPLFLGYLKGVPFLWTLTLWKEWAFMLGALLVIYFLWDTWAYRHERPEARHWDEAQIEPLRLAGLLNVAWLVGVVLAVATLDPTKNFPGTQWRAFPYLREGVQLLMVVLSLATTAQTIRRQNDFNYTAIGEVAALFIGIFITMQAPIEILQLRGGELGLHAPWHFFWASGLLSSVLDNAPTYVVFFETAGALHEAGMPLMHNVQTAVGVIPIPLLIAISCGAVFMGANTYIGNGPNFMVKAIVEQAGVKMPSFFGYMLYSGAVLVPLFVIMTVVMFL
jgi:Na+/H+ antiporter NhaD/arsenite permease-like protein